MTEHAEITQELLVSLERCFEASDDTAQFEIGKAYEVKVGRTSGSYVEIHLFPRNVPSGVILAFNINRARNVFGEDCTMADFDTGKLTCRMAGFYKLVYFVVTVHRADVDDRVTSESEN